MGETNIFKVLADSQRRDILTMLKNGRLNAGDERASVFLEHLQVPARPAQALRPGLAPLPAVLRH